MTGSSFPAYRYSAPEIFLPKILTIKHHNFQFLCVNRKQRLNLKTAPLRLRFGARPRKFSIRYDECLCLACPVGNRPDEYPSFNRFEFYRILVMQNNGKWIIGKIQIANHCYYISNIFIYHVFFRSAGNGSFIYPIILFILRE